jgi:hypothetical protein
MIQSLLRWTRSPLQSTGQGSVTCTDRRGWVKSLFLEWEGC